MGSSAAEERTHAVLVGSVVAGCVGVFGYAGYLRYEVNKPGQSHDDRTKHEVTLLSFYKNMVCSRRNIEEGRWWTLLTSTFTHATLMHLIFNMVGLWGFGQHVIRLYGFPVFVTVWAGAGVAGNALGVYWPQIEDKAIKRGLMSRPSGIRRGDNYVMGASAAVLGISVVVACTAPYMKMIMAFVPMDMWIGTAGFASYSVLALGNGWQPEIGHLEHLGGMAFGAVWWFLALRRRRRPGYKVHRR